MKNHETNEEEVNLAIEETEEQGNANARKEVEYYECCEDYRCFAAEDFKDGASDQGQIGL
jgi:hypothetical protein